MLSEAGVDDDVLLSQHHLIGTDESSDRHGEPITREQWMERMEDLCCEHGALEFVTQGQHNLRSLRDAFDEHHDHVSAGLCVLVGCC